MMRRHLLADWVGSKGPGGADRAADLLRREEERLQALFATHLLDTLPEPAFDDLVHLAAAVCDMPISVVTLLDRDRQWFKARVGCDVSETPRSDAFCAHAIQQEDLFVIPDATLDARFMENALVLGDPHIRFYAGMPIKGREGLNLGTLCVVDVVPRVLDAKQREMLMMLARQVSAQVQIHSQLDHLNQLIEEKQRAEAKLQESQLLFRAFMDHGPLVCFMKDEEGRMLYYNQAFANRFGINLTEWVGKTDVELWSPGFAAGFRAKDLAILAKGQLCVTDEPSPNEDGITWRTYKVPFESAQGGKLLAGMSLDVSTEKAAAHEVKRIHKELQRVNRELRELSLTDALTGLHNRRAFDETIESMFAAAKRKRRSLAMLMFDIDHFKHVNDTFGHEEGDLVLRKVARVLADTCRAGDMIARYGGEEFAGLLPDTDLNGALILAERFRHAIGQASWNLRGLTVSIGVSCTVGEGKTVYDLLRETDRALYRAKKEGRDRVAGWADDLVA